MIKYRLWDKRNKNMIYPEDNLSDMYLVLKMDGNVLLIEELNEYHSSVKNRPNLLPLEYIGLKDENGKGKEIYKGDIIKYHDDFYTDPADIGGRRHIVRDRLYIIWWHPLKAAFWLKSVPGGITSPILSLNCNKVGNIHENPELLEDQK